MRTVKDIFLFVCFFVCHSCEMKTFIHSKKPKNNKIKNSAFRHLCIKQGLTRKVIMHTSARVQLECRDSVRRQHFFFLPTTNGHEDGDRFGRAISLMVTILSACLPTTAPIRDGGGVRPQALGQTSCVICVTARQCWRHTRTHNETPAWWATLGLRGRG